MEPLGSQILQQQKALGEEFSLDQVCNVIDDYFARPQPVVATTRVQRLSFIEQKMVKMHESTAALEEKIKQQYLAKSEIQEEIVVEQKAQDPQGLIGAK